MIPIIYADLIDDVGNLAKFEEIYEKYRQQMFFRANQILKNEYEAEDALQDAFIGIARNMKTINTIANSQDLFYYLMRAAENAAYNRIRQTKHYATAVPLEDAPFVSDRSFWDKVCTQIHYISVGYSPANGYDPGKLRLPVFLHLYTHTTSV